jgi:hypothetical protein
MSPIDRGADRHVLEHESVSHALSVKTVYFSTRALMVCELSAPLDKESRGRGAADGFVSGTIIECPMHNGRFDFTTGEAKGAPACIDLKTYPVRIESGRILLRTV